MTKRARAVLVLKLSVAAVAIVGVVSIPARQLAPHLSIAQLALVVLCALAALVLLAVWSLTLAQFILRKGGTDAQWFWFRGEPPGLERLRRSGRDGHPMSPDSKDLPGSSTRSSNEEK